MHDCIGLCLSYLLFFLQRTRAHCLLIMTALICFFNACMSTCDTTYVQTRCVHVDCRLYGTAIRQGSALCCCCLPCTCTLNAVIMAHVSRVVAALWPVFLLCLLGVVHTTWFVWCTTPSGPENPFAPLGLNSNDDIHSTTRLLALDTPTVHLQEPPRAICKSLHHLVCNFWREHWLWPYVSPSIFASLLALFTYHFDAKSMCLYHLSSAVIPEFQWLNWQEHRYSIHPG